MAEREWTEGQLDAIRARRGTVLVAAAAGSGKTAVLVRRALERLTDPEHPTAADRLLIVTFTNAAAAEMRARLEQELFALLREDPGSALLRRQSILLSQAKIGTVHSFCGDMLREFFHLLGLSPQGKILTEKQQEELRHQALGEAVEAAFAAGTLRELADAFAGERDDRRLTAMVLRLSAFMQSHPFPERWLEEKTGLYFRGDAGLWQEAILRHARETAAHCRALCTGALTQAGAYPGAVGPVFVEALESDRTFLEELCAALDRGSWDGARQLLRSWAPQRRKPVKGTEKDAFFYRMDAVREGLKDEIDGLKKLFAPSAEDCAAELRQAAPLVESLKNLTLDFSRRYAEKKRAGDFLDYDDLEHLCIRLFLHENGERTDAAREVGARFDEIMVDEYQDTNEVQDVVFRAISRNGENLFLVGDVKQSIYGFRQAKPELFLRARQAYPAYDRARDEYPATVVLDRNFRSRRNVTDTVNFVFSRLMSRETGEIDYSGEERLVCGADLPEPEEPGLFDTELVLLERPRGVPAELAEPQWLAGRIREMVESGFPVTENGAQRPARWGDFAILLRSANKYAPLYARELTRLGVPARAGAGAGFFAAAEIGMLFSLLQVIDNPNQDIPLLAVLLSPIYGFSADDAARLRLSAGDRNVSLYVALGRAEDPRYDRVRREIAELRDLSATLSADAFLTLLYRRTGALELVRAMERGEEREANLRLLRAYAAEYENAGSHGVSGFVRYLERLRREGGDLEAASAPAQGGDAVSVTSVHHAKGLEFPVCIVAGWGREFPGESGDVLLHPELGLGVKLKEGQARYTTAAREAIALENARASTAEELRIYYVALTRAREKLILLGSGEKLERTIGRLGTELAAGGVRARAVRGARSALTWLILCALCHPDGAALRHLAGLGEDVAVLEDYTPWRIRLEEFAPAREPEAPPAGEKAPPDEAMLARLRAAIAYRYPYENELDIPAKVAASRLAEEQGADRELTLARPAWMGAAGMTPAQRGTALHQAMQFVDFHAAAAGETERELERLAAQGFLSPEQARAVDPEHIRAFVESPLGQRVLRSPHVERERRFTAVIPAALAAPERKGLEEETVILQGAVDCLFLEDGKLRIIDFKTDRVRDMEELWRRYEPQLRLYARAMEQVYEIEVAELILYSTHLDCASARKNA